MALVPWVPEEFAISRKKSSLPSFFPCLSNCSRCFFCNLVCFGLGLVLTISLELTVFFYLMQYLVKFSRRDVSVLNCLWNDIGYANLLCASSLIASCFSCFMVKILKDFLEMAVARERSRLVPLKAIPTGNSTPLANPVIEIPPVITVDVIRPVSAIPVIVLNRFMFLAICSRTSNSSRKYVSISDNLFNRYDYGFCGAVGFRSG